MQYWDTSTLLKLYVPETDSAQFAAHLSLPSVYTCELTRCELMRAIARKEMEGAIPVMSAEGVFSQFLSDVSTRRVILAPLDSAIEACFRGLVVRFHRQIPPVVVRTFDAIHLATADSLRADEVVTTDAHMRAGATAIGLKLFP